MKEYILRRFVFMLVLLVLVSVFAFIVIQLPPGDYLSTYVSRLEQELGGEVDRAIIDGLRRDYGLDRSPVEQYFVWVGNMFKGNFGRSFEWRRPVIDLLADRLPMTVALSLFTMGFTYLIAIPIGIFSARHQYSVFDYTFTSIGFLGLATPSFFLALVTLYFLLKVFGISAGGLYSIEYLNAPMSVDKFLDMLGHLPLPIFIIGLSGTASIIRVLRGQVLDEIKRPYVVAARARGLEENKLIYKYPVRVAINPIVSSMGGMLSSIVSGATVTAIVINIPTIGSLLYTALLSQDMFLAGSCIMILTFLTVVGMFISDVMLVVVDPRIRLNK